MEHLLPSYMSSTTRVGFNAGLPLWKLVSFKGLQISLGFSGQGAACEMQWEMISVTVESQQLAQNEAEFEWVSAWGTQVTLLLHKQVSSHEALHLKVSSVQSRL